MIWDTRFRKAPGSSTPTVVDTYKALMKDLRKDGGLNRKDLHKKSDVSYDTIKIACSELLKRGVFQSLDMPEGELLFPKSIPVPFGKAAGKTPEQIRETQDRVVEGFVNFWSPDPEQVYVLLPSKKSANLRRLADRKHKPGISWSKDGFLY